MRLVLLTGSETQHRYVARALATAFRDELKAIVLAEQRPEPLRARARRYWRRYTVPQLLSRSWHAAYAAARRSGERRRAVYERYLNEGADGGWGGLEGLLRMVPGHNSAASLALLSELQPDILAIYGTGIIRAPVIGMARSAAINMHTGISPRYRGSDTIFWALHNGEPEWVGVTIHMLDTGVDSGPIIAVGRPTIESSDTEDTLFCKALQVGTQLYVQAIREVAAGTRYYEGQDLETGRQYRFVDRTVGAERRVDRLLRQGLLREYAASR